MGVGLLLTHALPTPQAYIGYFFYMGGVFFIWTGIWDMYRIQYRSEHIEKLRINTLNIIKKRMLSTPIDRDTLVSEMHTESI